MKKCFIILLVILGCSKQEQPNPSNPSTIWKTEFTNDVLAAAIYPPIIYKDLVLVGHFTLTHDPKFIAFDKHTGDKLWEWNDFYNDWETGHFNSYQYENLWIFTTGPRVYAINLDTGETEWKTHAPETGDVRLDGIDKKIFHVRIFGDINQGNRIEQMVMCDIFKGQWKEVFQLEQYNHLQPSINDFVIDVNEKSDTLIWFVDFRYDFSQNNEYHLKVFNLTKDSFVVDEKLADLQIGEMPVIINDNVIFGGENIVCYDRNTYKQKWVNPSIHGDPFTFDNMLFIDEEIGSPVHHLRLNPETGKVIWNTQTSGSSSDLTYRDKRLFFIGGGDGKLHGIEAETGEYFWHFEAPELKQNSNLWFDESISVDKETGRIYTCDFKNIICYSPPNK